MAILTKHEPYGQMIGRIEFLDGGGPGRVVVQRDRIFYTAREGGLMEDVPSRILWTHGEFLKREMNNVS